MRQQPTSPIKEMQDSVLRFQMQRQQINRQRRLAKQCPSNRVHPVFSTTETQVDADVFEKLMATAVAEEEKQVLWGGSRGRFPRQQVVA